MSTAVKEHEHPLSHETEKLLACVHCGLCLEACPTYVVTGNENDSPRGRIYLMRSTVEQRLDRESSAFSTHIDRCLGCRACEQACPAGVQYGHLLEAAREDLRETGHKNRLLSLLLSTVWRSKALLSIAFLNSRLVRDLGVTRLILKSGIANSLPESLKFAVALLESSSASNFEPKSTAAAGNITGQAKTATTSAAIFTGCVMEGLFRRVNRATQRVLEANGCTVAVPSEQMCCGALHAHAGDLDGARNLAKQNIAAFASSDRDPVITNAGGCGAMLVSYGELLSDDPEWAERARDFSARVRDISQQLSVTGVRNGAPVTDKPVTYDASCHLMYGQHAVNEPIDLLKSIPGIKLVPLAEFDMCCGGAGVYNLLQPELSGTVLTRKLDNIKKTGAEYLATGNPGCHMQIAAGAMLDNIPLNVVHPVELLDESYCRAGFYKVEESDSP